MRYVIIILTTILLPFAAMASDESGRSYERVENPQGSYLMLWSFSEAMTVEVTSDDIKRGYVDVKNPLHYVVRSNRPEKFSLALRNISEAFDQVEVSVGANSTTFSDNGVLDFSVYDDGLGGRPLAISLKLMLAPGARAGVYPCPLGISPMPPSGHSPYWRDGVLKVWTDPRGGTPGVRDAQQQARLSL